MEEQNEREYEENGLASYFQRSHQSCTLELCWDIEEN